MFILKDTVNGFSVFMTQKIQLTNSVVKTDKNAKLLIFLSFKYPTKLWV